VLVTSFNTEGVHPSRCGEPILRPRHPVRQPFGQDSCSSGRTSLLNPDHR
jgi:hypothetical protein